jgi:hypothetical protein
MVARRTARVWQSGDSGAYHGTSDTQAIVFTGADRHGHLPRAIVAFAQRESAGGEARIR